jgi:hypothetical protein
VVLHIRRTTLEIAGAAGPSGSHLREVYLVPISLFGSPPVGAKDRFCHPLAGDVWIALSGVISSLQSGGFDTRVGFRGDPMSHSSVGSSLCAALIAMCHGMTASARCTGDINGDLSVDGKDIAYVLSSWGSCGEETCSADLTGDGLVNGVDLAALLAEWGPCPTPTRIVGSVVWTDGSAVVDAVIASQVGGAASTDAYGDFQLDVVLPPDAAYVAVTAVTSLYGVTYSGRATVVDVISGTSYELTPIMVVPTDASCQGDYEWVPTFGSAIDRAGINGFVGGMTAFDDGSGPALFMASAATSAGGVPIGYVAKWNGIAWSALGSGIQTLSGNPNYQSVLATAVYDDGTGPALYVGGDFDTAGGVPASCVARWNGETWSALGAGVDSGVHAMAVYDDGTGPALYVGGSWVPRAAFRLDT